MNNLHDVPETFDPRGLSLWFWVKAGFGFAIGFTFLATFAWIVFVLFGLGVVGALLGHH